MSDELIWAEPPPARRGGGVLGRIGRMVAELRKRPGEWAMDPVPQKFSTVPRNRRRSYPGTEWTSRSRPDGLYDVYGRWVGES